METVIKQTTDYRKFKTILGNRIVSERRVNNIIADIKAGLNLLPYCPIIVYVNADDKKPFCIIDGQHRFEVCKRLKEPIYYIESKELNLLQIAKINSRSEKWTKKNFLDCYVNLGLKDYIVLRDFIKKYNVVYSTAISFLMEGRITGGGALMEKFRNGEFKVNYFDIADKIVSLTMSLFSIYVFSRDRYLIAAVQQINKKEVCDWEVLRRKIKAAPNEMDKQYSKKDYLLNIERLYNYGNKNRIAIY